MSTQSEIYEYLKTFLIQNNWDDEYTRGQARALWTSYCLIGDLRVDTGRYDNDLLLLFDVAAIEELVTYEDFDNYMAALLI